MNLAGAAAVVNARAARLAPFSFPFCVKFQCRPSPLRRVERRDAFASRACPRARASARHGARTRAPQHSRVATVKAKPGLGPSLRAPPRPPSPVLAAPPPCRGGHVTEPLCPPCRGIPLAPCRTPGQGRTGPTSSASLAATPGVEPCAAVAPPRHPSRARAETPARFAQTHQRTPCTPISTSRRRTPRERSPCTPPRRHRAHAGDRRARRTPAALAVS
jgi:hypothetical protein